VFDIWLHENDCNYDFYAVFVAFYDRRLTIAGACLGDDDIQKQRGIDTDLLCVSYNYCYDCIPFGQCIYHIRIKHVLVTVIKVLFFKVPCHSKNIGLI